MQLLNNEQALINNTNGKLLFIIAFERFDCDKLKSYK